ncbi:hypothetical protein B0H14DRAFT_1169847 [Mycena olivaceomarginata]|nr:hypothetical protein B0H14DRAFT_1169847 [Mycena olivaceomarginata]
MRRRSEDTDHSDGITLPQVVAMIFSSFSLLQVLSLPTVLSLPPSDFSFPTASSGSNALQCPSQAFSSTAHNLRKVGRVLVSAEASNREWLHDYPREASLPKFFLDIHIFTFLITFPSRIRLLRPGSGYARVSPQERLHLGLSKTSRTRYLPSHRLKQRVGSGGRGWYCKYGP